MMNATILVTIKLNASLHVLESHQILTPTHSAPGEVDSKIAMNICR